MPHAARRPRSWLIFDVRQQAIAMLPSSVILRDSAAMQVDASGRVKFSVIASVAGRKGPAPQAGAQGKFRVVDFRTTKKTDSLPEARQHFIGKLAAECSSTYPSRSPNKAPEPTTMAITPRAIARVIELKPQNMHRSSARGAPATVVAHL